ncbi:MAG: hypothetical protein LBB56_05480, partial [Chitinispirillales bacterium]|nr:hypothetical protein [Chitinispirillales bacterium]
MDLEEKNVQAMIEALSEFQKKATAATTELESGGRDFADNFEGDPVGAKVNASLSQKLAKINEQLGEASRISSLL